MPLDRTVDRRTLLRLGAVGALGGLCLPVRALACGLAAEPPERSLAFYQTHTGEHVSTLYWAEGRYLPQGLSEIDRVLRDHRTGEVTEIDRGLLDLLHRLAAVLETSEPFHVISGYRSTRTNTRLAAQGRGVAPRSLHLSGQAIDLRVPHRELRQVREHALRLRGGGVGYYPSSDFVHVDVGRVRWW